jgi:penicillin amidase
MIRRWLGNDTWALLGGPVPPGTEPPAGVRERVLAALPGALAAAWAAAVAAGGPDPRQWRWGDVHHAVRVHPIAGPVAGPFAHAEMGGDSDTIQAAAYGWRQGTPFTVSLLSVYRQVADLSDPVSSTYVIPGGASGDPSSPHFADQFPLWATHQRIPTRS